jgi:hypothetical protein
LNATIVGHLTAAELVSLGAHWLTLWLGLTLLSRRPRTSATMLAGAAILVGSAYMLSVVFLLTPESGRADVFWDASLGNLTPFAPVLLMHAFLALTGVRLLRQRLVLWLLYLAAAGIVVLSFFGTLLFAYHVPPGAAKGVFVVGPLEPLQVLQSIGTFSLGVFVLLRARRVATSAVRGQLTLLAVGSALALLGLALMFADLYVASLPFETPLDALAVLGCFVMAVPFVRYRGLLEGQLLRSDLKSSLLSAALVMGLFLVITSLVGATSQWVAELGWLVLAVFVLGDELRALADRAFFGAGERAGRAGLRTVASYAGTDDALDLASLSPGQSAELVEYLGALDRADFARMRLEGPEAQRLALLAREEFAPVRSTLELPPDWSPVDGLSRSAVERRMKSVLEPRERQALGLRYLGYSDKEMARLMHVKPGVPRSYLSAAKHKLALPAGAPLQLFVHLTGLVESDALPLLEVSEPGAASSREATRISPGAAVEDPS